MSSVHRIGGVFVCFVCQKAAREFYIREEAIFQTPHYHLLQAHLAESHKITGQPRGFQCPYCVIHPANYEALVKHLTADHDTAALMVSLVNELLKNNSGSMMHIYTLQIIPVIIIPA